MFTINLNAPNGMTTHCIEVLNQEQVLDAVRTALNTLVSGATIEVTLEHQPDTTKKPDLETLVQKYETCYLTARSKAERNGYAYVLECLASSDPVASIEKRVSIWRGLIKKQTVTSVVYLEIYEEALESLKEVTHA